MKLGVLFSGGKDSCLALHLAHERGYKIECLITVAAENKDSFLFHTPTLKWVRKQAESLRIPLLQVKSKGEKEKEVEDLKRAVVLAIKKYKIQGVVTGAVRSIYQASRIQRVCNELGIECFNPLWLRSEEEHLQEILKKRMQCVVTKVSAYGFDRSWVGREIDSAFLYDIKKLWEKYGVSMIGEGGEYESFVLDAPLFKESLVVKSSKVVADRHSSLLDIQNIFLERK